MRRALIGAAVGLIAGAAGAALLAMLVHLNQQPANPSTVRVIDGSGSMKRIDDPFFWKDESRAVMPLGDRLYHAVLLGGGFGAIVGVVVGATGMIVRALREDRPAGIARSSGTMAHELVES